MNALSSARATDRRAFEEVPISIENSKVGLTNYLHDILISILKRED